ncbi:MAG: hypothetical protein V1734_02075 [Nanoarchaeota archaeon]
MNKNTLANIVIKAVRQANSVIDSSYEFPEICIRANEEIEFRNNVTKYHNACFDYGRTEERTAYTQNILEYAASVQANEDYGKKLPGVIKAVKQCKISTRIGVLACYGGAVGGYFLSSIPIMMVSLFGFLQGGTNNLYNRIWERIHGKPLEKKLIEEYYDYSLQEDIAKELREVNQKDFNEAIFENWDELTVALEDVCEKEKKRLLGKKSWE